MYQKRKNFIIINTGFICDNCKHKNDPLKGGCRNHCKKCLYSKHVDKEIPGDRSSSCGFLMKPLEIDSNGKKGYIIKHECTGCGKISKNKIAYDDDFDSVIKISKHERI